MLLFQLLAIIGVVAPPSKSHMALAPDLVMVSNSNKKKIQVYAESTW